MTELLIYGPDSPQIVIDDDGEIHDPSDFPEFQFGEESNNESFVEDLPQEAAYDKEHTRLEFPQSVEENKTRIRRIDLARQAIVEHEPTAQEELGGGIIQADEYDNLDVPMYRPLDAAIRGSKEWHTAIYDAVERFGMNELTLQAYGAMNRAEKAAFSLRFKRYYDLANAAKRRIDAVEGDAELDARLLHGSGIHTKEEFNEYSERLAVLKTGLEATGIPAAVTDHVNELRRTQTKRVRLNWDKINYRDYTLAFKLLPDGTKKPVRVK